MFSPAPFFLHPFFSKVKSALRPAALIKVELRKQHLRHRQSLSASEFEEKTAHLLDRLRVFPPLIAARSLAAFFPAHKEPDLTLFYQEWLGSGKILLFPRLIGEELGFCPIRSFSDLGVKNRFGIAEPPPSFAPVDPKAIDVVLVPGLVFDLAGNRVGYGRGYYDRFLPTTAAHKIGVAFDFQVCEKLPQEEHDVKMEALVTPTKIYIF